MRGNKIVSNQDDWAPFKKCPYPLRRAGIPSEFGTGKKEKADERPTTKALIRRGGVPPPKTDGSQINICLSRHIFNGRGGPAFTIDQLNRFTRALP
jgi:hypothetical protein